VYKGAIMNLNNFENEIDDIILKRGKSYYEGGCVTELKEMKDNEWSAVVEGTERYTVKVKLTKNKSISSTCSCPYENGPFCKHEAAVYYAIRNSINADTDKTPVKETAESRLIKILDKLDKDKLKDIIIEHALDNNKFYNYLIAAFSPSDNASVKAEYKQYLKACINDASDRHGFIDYYSTAHATEGAYQLISDAEKALGNSEFEKAVIMAQAVIEVMVSVFDYADDSNGDISSAVDDAFEILDDVLSETLTETIRKELFLYCIRESAKKKYNDYGSWQDDFIYLASKASASEEENEKILGVVEQNIKKATEGNFHSSYSAGQFSMMKYDLLKKMNRINDAEKFFNDNLMYRNFRKMAIEEAFGKKDYDRVIELAGEGDRINAGDRYRADAREWKEWRYKAYTAKNDTLEINKLSYEFLINYSDIKYYDTFKKTSDSAEWDEIYKKLKAELLKKSRNYFSHLLADILVIEGELPELLEMLKKEPWHVESYQKHFLKTNAQDIYKMHVINIRKDAEMAGDRSRYQRVCRDLRSLKKIGGKSEAAMLVAEFKEKFKKRPAFIDELSKV